VSSADERKQRWTPLVEFATHTILGTAIFVVIFVPVIGLNFAVHSLEVLSIDAWVIWLVRATETIVALGDVLLYLTFLWKTGKRAAVAF
jgi:hypothetical protein